MWECDVRKEADGSIVCWLQSEKVDCGRDELGALVAPVLRLLEEAGDCMKYRLVYGPINAVVRYKR